MKRIVIALALVAVMAAPASALRRFGQIDKDFRYNRLEIARNPSGVCTMRGQIENQTRGSFRDVYFKVYAQDRDGDFLWDTIFRLNIGPNQTVEFSTKIFDCDGENNPYEMTWDITGK
jgi:hypothetical protein